MSNVSPFVKLWQQNEIHEPHGQFVKVCNLGSMLGFQEVRKSEYASNS